MATGDGEGRSGVAIAAGRLSGLEGGGPHDGVIGDGNLGVAGRQDGGFRGETSLHGGVFPGGGSSSSRLSLSSGMQPVGVYLGGGESVSEVFASCVEFSRTSFGLSPRLPQS